MEKINQFNEKIDLLNKSLHKFKENRDRFERSLNSIDYREIEFECLNLILNNIINKIDEISFDIDELQYYIDLNEINPDVIIKNRIKENEKFKNFVSIFAPYIFLFNILYGNNE